MNAQSHDFHTTETEGRTPDAIDVHVGQRVRLRRRQRGLSQTELATAVGITFQQVQKYERATNRISASRLYKIAEVLQVDLSYFFQGLPCGDGDDGGGSVAPTTVEEFLSTREGLTLAEIVANMPRTLRAMALRVLRAMAADQSEG